MKNNRKGIYQLILQFVDRQDLVFQALKDLRPQILISTGAITWEELEHSPKSRFEIAQTGYWGEDYEWKYFIHGLGCKLVHTQTKEPIEWNTPNLRSFDMYWFINWLNWYLKSGIDHENSEFAKFQHANDIETFVVSSLLELERGKLITHLSSQYPNEYTVIVNTDQDDKTSS
ncbi:MAG: hypothetical protein SF123_11665 [Chloroflexota bacterium]|nr:hypothetical protein [Chloroflexota bacterium]